MASLVASVQMRAETDRVILTYSHRSRGGDRKEEEYPVYIARTACHLGGSRAWFICPAVGCRRRVAILYGGSIFACRHCHQLAYESTREDAGDRAARRANWIRRRLGWEAGFLNGDGWKPKWMRWKTFWPLKAGARPIDRPVYGGDFLEIQAQWPEAPFLKME